MCGGSYGHLHKRVKSLREVTNDYQEKRKFHSLAFKAEALKLAEKTSAPSAEKELGLKESQLYT